MPQQISSYVLTPGGRPVRDAEVEVGGRVLAKTDANGAFLITIAKPKRRTGITIKAVGFMTNTRVVGERSRSLPPVILAPVGNRVTIDGRRGGTLYFGSTKLEVPANAFRTDRGRPVTGPVRFEFTLLDVTNRTQLSAAMGDFTGRMLDGSTRSLRSFGIFQIRAYDRSGGILELAREREIRFSIEVPERLRPTSPRQVGLFSFDRADGRWIQEGVVELGGGANGEPLVYNGSIDRIDWGWNLDDPTTITCVTVKVVDSYGNPMDNMTVTAHGSSYTSTGMTNADGLVCLLVQRNDSVRLGAWGTVGQSHWQVPSYHEPTVTVPDVESGASDCGDPDRCPLIATLEVWLIVGLLQRERALDAGADSES